MEYRTLSNGVTMPLVGFGVYQIGQDDCTRCVTEALDCGYRLIDTAQSYFNEEQVGTAIANSDVPREDLFLTSKVWLEHYGHDACRASLEESLRKLKTDYLDLMLLHQPFGDAYGAWRALEEAYEEGLVRAIGISNFSVDRMVEFSLYNRIVPHVIQMETHPLNQQIELKKWADKYGIQLEAWSPLGGGRGGLMDNEVLGKIGAAHGKTAAQVMLRWNVQREVVVVAKSTHKERMQQNLDVFDFELNDDEMAQIAALDTKTSCFFDHRDPVSVEWMYHLIEQRRHNHDIADEKKPWD